MLMPSRNAGYVANVLIKRSKSVVIFKPISTGMYADTSEAEDAVLCSSQPLAFTYCDLTNYPNTKSGKQSFLAASGEHFPSSSSQGSLRQKRKHSFLLHLYHMLSSSANALVTAEELETLKSRSPDGFS